MRADLARRYSAPVPRYTSYPTAPHFSGAVGVQEARRWLSALPISGNVSLYVHLPFCQQLCYYCGCSTKVVNRYEPIAEYLDVLEDEIRAVSALVPAHRVTHLHWGGGSPNMLSPDDILRLADRLKKRFTFADDAEFAVEIDPRGLDRKRAEAFADAGVSRVSIGVQAFEADVQRAINREQSFQLTRDSVTMLRQVGIEAINIDLVYGLPHETRAGADRTIDQVLLLDPDRIAIFGYAHLPDRIKHQRLIDDNAVPGAEERLGQALRVQRRLIGAGYQRIGLDHFAKPTDPLVVGRVRRNFQGYTTDGAGSLIGLGASSISRLPQGYLQNVASVRDYREAVERDGLATARGVELTEDDRVRAYVIERLMCDFEFSKEDVMASFGERAVPVIRDAEALIESDRDGLVEPTPQGFRVSEAGRLFVRSLCACFDAYLGSREVRYSTGI